MPLALLNLYLYTTTLSGSMTQTKFLSLGIDFFYVIYRNLLPQPRLNPKSIKNDAIRRCI